MSCCIHVKILKLLNILFLFLFLYICLMLLLLYRPIVMCFQRGRKENYQLHLKQQMMTEVDWFLQTGLTAILSKYLYL